MDSLGMRRLPMTSVGQRICGAVLAGGAVNWGRAWTCAWRCGALMAANRRSNESRSALPRPKRLERVRTGWDEHFSELALTRIPEKITTPSLHFDSLSCTLSAGDLIIGDIRGEGERRGVVFVGPFDVYLRGVRFPFEFRVWKVVRECGGKSRSVAHDRNNGKNRSRSLATHGMTERKANAKPKTNADPFRDDKQDRQRQSKDRRRSPDPSARGVGCGDLDEVGLGEKGFECGGELWLDDRSGREHVERFDLEQHRDGACAIGLHGDFAVRAGVDERDVLRGLGVLAAGAGIA